MIEITDYTTFTTLKTSIKRRRELKVGDIFENKAQCKRCGTTIRSRNKHDLVYCKCQGIGVDGGSHYARRVGDPSLCEEMSVMYNHQPKVVDF